MKTNDLKTVVIIPALNEVDSIGLVLSHIPQSFSQNIVVVDNGSTDGTDKVAKKHEATVIYSSMRGYGSACLAGIQFARQLDPDVYIFLDADFSDYPEDMEILVNTLLTANMDLVIGSRLLGQAEEGSLLPQARFGNWLATWLMYLRFGFRFSDLGPFRAIRASALEKLDMEDKNFGWTVEMQVKALKEKLRVGEVSVRYRKRIGVSKITGTIKGSIMAGIKILWTIARFGI